MSQGGDEVSKGRRAQKVNPRQFNFLVDYMLSHSDFAAGRFVGGQDKANLKGQWRRLADDLNKLGPERSVDKWMRAWSDLKFRTRQKSSAIASALRSNQDFPASLSDLEKKVLAVTGGESSVCHVEVQDATDEPRIAFDVQSLQFIQSTSPDLSNGVDGDYYNSEGVDVVLARATSTPLVLAPPPVEFVEAKEEASPEENASLEEAAPVCAARGRALKVGAPKRCEEPKDGYARLKEICLQREQITPESRERYAEIQEKQLEIQGVMAAAFSRLVEIEAGKLDLDRERLRQEKARLEQDKTNTAALLAMANAVSRFARAIEQEDV